MLPPSPTPDPTTLDSADLAALMGTLTDEQTSDLLAAVDAAEVLSKQRNVDMGASALWYATTLRWRVFPLTPRGKKPATRHGFKDASVDPERIAAWWADNPDYNLGIPTGPVEDGGCGYDVVDIDGAAGIAAWATLKHRACPPDCSAETFCPAPGPFDIRARAYTPGNGVDRGPGRHLYVPATGKGNTTGLGGQAIDWRGRGGYVCAPPSVNLYGARYSWLTLPTPDPAPPAAA